MNGDPAIIGGGHKLPVLMRKKDDRVHDVAISIDGVQLVALGLLLKYMVFEPDEIEVLIVVMAQQLAGSSEVNANPADTKDHPEGVWTLPPSYRLKDKDRAKYAAIGESDRFILKFQKPGP